MPPACTVHKRRKGSGVPYVAHLMSVSALVLEDGGDEDQAIAALLHDAVEDQGGVERLADIEARFGARVAGIVKGCSDSDSLPKPPWRERKEAYLRHLAEASPDILRVSMADKVHNARSILADYRQIGEALWARFTGGKEGTLWYYHTLLQICPKGNAGYLLDELERVVAELDQLVAEAGG